MTSLATFEPAEFSKESVDPHSDWRNDEQLIVDLAKALHQFGASSYDLEDFILSYAQQLGHDVEVFYSPTSLFLSFDHGEFSRTIMSRMHPGGIDLGKLAEVYQLVDDLKDQSFSGSTARKRLNDICNQSDRVPHWISILSFAIAIAAATGFFGGGWREAITSGIIGLVLGTLGHAAQQYQGLRRVLPVLSAALAALLAAVGSLCFDPISIEIVTLSSLIVLIPGLTITTAISELAQDHLTSGASRLVGALVQLLSIVLGVAVGRALTSQIIDTKLQTAIPLPEPMFWAFLLIAPLAFVILFRARRQDTLWIVLTCIVAFLSTRWAQNAYGAELGAAFGCFVLGIVSNVLSRITNRPAQVMLVPSLLILVPGSVGFQAVQAFVDHQTIEAVQSAFSTMFVAAALVSGLLVANFVVQPRSLNV